MAEARHVGQRHGNAYIMRLTDLLGFEVGEWGTGKENAFKTRKGLPPEVN